MMNEENFEIIELVELVLRNSGTLRTTKTRRLSQKVQ